MNMRDTLNSILDGDDENKNKNNMKTHVTKMVDLLEELRFEFNHKFDEVLKPVYKKDIDPIDVLKIPGLTRIQKLILVILRNREVVTTNQLIELSGCGKQAVNRSLNHLRNEGYVKKLKASTYSIINPNIF